MAHLVIKRKTSIVFQFDGTLNSGYILELARVWRREKRAFIMAIVILFVLGVATTAPIIVVGDFADIFKLGKHSMGLHAIQLLLVISIAAVLLFSLTRLLRSGIEIAVGIVEDVMLAHHLFRTINLDEEYPRYMHSQVMNRSNHLYNLLMVNDNFEQRVNWFAVNACPKILPLIIRKKKVCDFQIAKDHTGGFGMGMYIAGVAVPIGVYLFFLNAMSFYSMFSSLPLVALTLVAILMPYLLSYLSYKAAVIKALSGKLPSELSENR